MNRDFKGVWIPREIWLDERLNALDKIILTEIDSLDKGDEGCYASNQYIAEFCQCGVTKVSTSIAKLLKLDYLFIKKFDGRNRILKSNLSKNERLPFKKCEADFQNLKHTNIYTNIEYYNNKQTEEGDYDYNWINEE
ncbi:MAG: helix-turn-helix domain-containing protein [Bacilli bacterium]|nr:helix-turn-helix domain-containing protein [Clostridia bacterium]MBQ4584556.1 helix-turn-helix domain-containing protein [Bacilli bacterium]MBR0058191.1 helix-turn-helix domain-containing protein [Methanobrevibacter sp.]MBR0371561.1 helix-turn-helix domain-containing protein [Methanobrevibacter sp.]